MPYRGWQAAASVGLVREQLTEMVRRCCSLCRRHGRTRSMMAVSVTEVVAMLSVPEAVGGEDDDDDGHE